MYSRRLRGPVRLASIATALVLLCVASPGARQAALPTAREVIDRSVQAAGGAAAFKAVRSIRGRGTVTIPSQKLTGEFEMVAARPNKTLTTVTLAGIGRLEEGYNGKIGWSIDPVSGPALVTGRALMDRADEAWFDAPLHGPDFVKSVAMVGREDFDKRPAYRIKVVLVSGGEQDELFDVETGLPIGLEARRETPFGSAPTTTIHREYRKYGALMLPSSQVQRVLGIEQVVTFTSYEFNVVPGSAFDLPAAVKVLVR
jgi:hypothetical protein